MEFKTSDGIDLILDRAQAPSTNGRVQSRFLSFSGSGQGSNTSTASQYQQLNKDCSFAELYKYLDAAESVNANGHGGTGWNKPFCPGEGGVALGIEQINQYQYFSSFHHI